MSLRKTFQRQFSRSDGKKKNGGETSTLPIFDNLENEQLLTAEQLAERLNIAVKTVQKWRYEKVLPAEAMVKLRHQVRYRWGMVLRWLSSKEI